VLAPTPRVRARLGSDEPRQFDAVAGQIVINPANVESSWEWPGVMETAVIALTEASFRELAEQEFDSGSAELVPPPFGALDTTALSIAHLIRADLREGGNELYLDTLITLFGIHLLRNYTSSKKTPRQAKGGLSGNDVRKIRDHLNENFTRQISVKELAALVDLSPKHFIHAFARSFGAAPHRYLVDLRLDFAERLLLGGNLAIAEVAYLSGFSSQSHLTATMKKYRRMTPTKSAALEAAAHSVDLASVARKRSNAAASAKRVRMMSTCLSVRTGSAG
jgi:AraC family transcriptional regulator